MKKRIIQTTLALTALVASFLPQKAEACKSFCYDEDNNITSECEGNFACLGCIFGVAVCFDWP